MVIDNKVFNDFIFEIYPGEEQSKDCATHSDFILRSGDKKIEVTAQRGYLNFISLRCVERLDLDFRFNHHLLVHDNYSKIGRLKCGTTYINIKTIDGKHSIKIFLYVVDNLKEYLILGSIDCWDLVLSYWCAIAFSCPEDDEDF